MLAVRLTLWDTSPNLRGVGDYTDQIGAKPGAKWSVQICAMIFQTRFRVY